MNKIYTYINGKLEEKDADIVREFPLKLIVNERELATLVASPHDLRFLVAGFLKLQGFVDSVNDFEMLSVCNDFGIANVKTKKELPERLQPVLTSGCGTGITFSLPEAVKLTGEFRGVSPDAIFALMDELARRAENYKAHGGIHSAAVGDENGLLLYAEDLGRHNTIDRLAGEGLLKGLDLAGKILVTSGRVSTEMVAKAARLGIAVIASRTSPTDLAVKMSEESGITLIGYLRGGKFNVYSHPSRLEEKKKGPATSPEDEVKRAVGAKTGTVTGVILAGGESRRMGSNKALLPYRGGRFIEAIYRQMADNFDEVLLVTNTPDVYSFIPCRKVADLHSGMGPLGGIHSGLCHACNENIFVVGCDMPYLNTALIRRLTSLGDTADIIIPESPGGLEPLHALYGKSCIQPMEEAFAVGEKKIISFFERVKVCVVSKEEVAAFDPGFHCFSNINTQEEYYCLRDAERDDRSRQAEKKA